MQKKVIALALAALVSGAAFAQSKSNVTVYGGIDVGPVVYFGSKNGTRNMTAVEQGRWSSVRLGFKGGEDLGDGLKLKWKMDIAMYPVDKEKIAPKSGYIGLEGKFGEVLLGAVGTFADDLQGDISTMFGHDTLAAGDDVWMQASGSAQTDDMLNAIAWYSPKWSGFQVKAAVSTATDTVDAAPISGVGAGDDGYNDRVYALGVGYENGPLVAGAYVETSKPQSTGNDDPGAHASYDRSKQWGLGASYDFKFMRVHGVYNRIHFAETSDNDGIDVRKQWQVGVSIPVTKNGTLAFAYTRAKNENYGGEQDDKQKHIGVGYWHMLSKTAALYAAYGQISQDDKAGGGSDDRKIYFDGDGRYSKGLQTGLRYKF